MLSSTRALHLAIALPVSLTLATSACDPGEPTPTVPRARGPALRGRRGPRLRVDRPRRDALSTALEDTPGEWPRQLVDTLDARVTEHGPRWRSTYTHACAEDDQQTQRCLDAQLWELDAVVDLIIEDPARAALAWAELSAALRDAEACVDRDTPGVDAPALSLDLGRRWAALRILLDTLDDPDLRERARELETDASIRDTPSYALPLAAAEVVVATLAGQADAAASSRERLASLVAELGPRGRMSAAQLDALAAFARRDAEAGLAAAREAVAAAREQPDPWLVFARLRELGRAQLELGDPEGALEPLAEAVSLSTRLASAENPYTADVQISLAEAHVALGRIDAAYDLLTQARDSFVNTLGPDHPRTLASVESTGRLFVQAGQPGDAQFAFLDLLEVYTDLYGPKDWHTALIKVELGDTLMAMEQHDSARTLYSEALVPLVDEFGAGHRAVIRAVIHLGIAEFALDNLDEARKHCERGLNLARALPPDDWLTAEAQLCVTQLGKA